MKKIGWRASGDTLLLRVDETMPRPNPFLSYRYYFDKNVKIFWVKVV